MSRDSALSQGLSPRAPEKLARALAGLTLEEQAELEQMVRLAVQDVANMSVGDLWLRPPTPVTYWILLLSGVNQPEEMRVAQALLSWQSFFSKHTARVYCVQSSERSEFRLCSSAFDIADCPTLVFSNEPEMESFIHIDPQLLFELTKEEGGMQRFLTRIHTHIENGRSLRDVSSMLTSEKFWKGLKMVYNEVKGLTKLTISTK